MWMKNTFLHTNIMRGRCVLDRVVIRFTTIFAVSVYHAKVVSSNSAHEEVYFIQLYEIKFVSDLRQVHGFLIYSGSSIN